jgi:methionine synthase I (cobalamin-dependent)
MSEFVHPGVREDMAGKRYLDACEGFIARGVTHCGGCCETTPEQIALLAQKYPPQ